MGRGAAGSAVGAGPRRQTWGSAWRCSWASAWGCAWRLAASVGLSLPLLSACAVEPTAGRPALHSLPQAVPVKAAASAVDVIGRQGEMSRPQKESALRQLAQEGGGAELNRHLLAMARFDDVDLYAHNQTQLLVDGPRTFAAMFQAIESAQHSVLLQSYIIEDAAISQRLAQLLARKRAQGVGVAVLYDAVGSIGTPTAFFDALRAAGVPVCAFNPVNPLERVGYWDITHRDHRKILSVDRAVGFTGGINISAVYASGSFGRARLRRADDPTRSGWRDTQIRIAGPAVAALDDLVRGTWQQQGCAGALPALPRPTARPAPQAAAGDDLVRIVASGPAPEPSAGAPTPRGPVGAQGRGQPRSPNGGAPAATEARIYAMLLNAVDTARHSVHITMAYFAPGAEMVQALCDAARRGVDVRLVLPSMSDFSPVLHAGRSHYTRLLAAGVRLYELNDAVLHAKTAVVDGVVSTVGSSNMDWRSFTANNEVNAVVFGQDFGQAMARVFEADLARSTEITRQAWAERPLWQRAKEHLARALERLW